VTESDHHCESYKVYRACAKNEENQKLPSIGPFHADVSVRACTSCRPLLITNKQKGCGRWVVGYCCWAPFRKCQLCTVSYRKYLF